MQPLTGLLLAAGLVLGGAASEAAAVMQIRQEVAVANHPFAGEWIMNVPKSRLSPLYPFKSGNLRVVLNGNMLTMASEWTLASGESQAAAETFPTDGTESFGTLNAGITLMAKWLDPHVLASLAKKDGAVVAIVVYEVSSDGRTLTSRSSGSVDQAIVFDKK